MTLYCDDELDMLLIVAQKAVIFDYILAFEKQSESQESSQRPLSRQYWHRLSYSPQMFDDVLSLDMKLATAISGSLMTFNGLSIFRIV